MTDPNNYFFWNNTQPTTTVHLELGNEAYAAVIAAISEPGRGPWAGGVIVLLALAQRAGRGWRD